MRSLFREVVLPAAASVGFLFAMAIPRAEGQEVAAASGPAVMLASTRLESSVATDEAGADASGDSEPTTLSTPDRAAPRCVRVKRIGKFIIQRWE